MTFSARADLKLRPAIVSRPPSVRMPPRTRAGPQEMLGSGGDVVYLTELARALSGPEAASIASFPPREVTTPGWRVDATA
ncbi:MAG: hypothetical protein ACOCYP_01885 [Planctomycetota bacterium]